MDVIEGLAGKLSRRLTRISGGGALDRALRRAWIRYRSGGYVDRIAADPLNPELHLDFARFAARRKRPYLALAELKTASCLGAAMTRIAADLRSAEEALPDVRNMNHNQYYRFYTLASEVLSRRAGAQVSVLDVGGGEGRLASFLPDTRYCLAEPGVNGISGVDLPFADNSFDFVVSCHVLEHIPVSERPTFLDQLVAKARRGVILLNPFYVEGTHVDERLRFFVEITGAKWAREHLDCSLPRVDDVAQYAAKNGLRFEAKPNGTLATTFAFVFVDYFAGRSGRRKDWLKVNRFFNERYKDILDSREYPTGYLVYLGRPDLADPVPT